MAEQMMMVEQLKEELLVAGYMSAAELLLDGIVAGMATLPEPLASFRHRPEVRSVVALVLGGLIMTSPKIVEMAVPGTTTPEELQRLGSALRTIGVTGGALRAVRSVVVPLLQSAFTTALKAPSLLCEGLRGATIPSSPVSESVGGR